MTTTSTGPQTTAPGDDQAGGLEEGISAVSPSALAVIEKAQTDQAIETAHRYPRSIQQFKQEALALATLDQETAASCIYSLPRKDSRGGSKIIEGPSVRLAEIVVNAWGNFQAATRIIGEDPRFVTAQGVARDLEKNVTVSAEIKRRITGRTGRRYGDDMIAVTANAAASIALRNAVFRVVPRAFVMAIYREARKTAIGDASTLNDRRLAMLDHFAKLSPHLTPERICAALEKKAVDDIGLEDLATLHGIANAIHDGQLSIDEAFPEPEEPADDRPQAEKVAADLRKRRAKDAAKETKAKDKAKSSPEGKPAKPAKEPTKPQEAGGGDPKGELFDKPGEDPKKGQAGQDAG